MGFPSDTRLRDGLQTAGVPETASAASSQQPPKVPTFFRRECPVCGRPLQISVELLGKQVVCRHCGVVFSAWAPGLGAEPQPPHGSLMERTHQLLEMLTAADSPSEEQRFAMTDPKSHDNRGGDPQAEDACLRQRILRFLRMCGVDGLETIQIAVEHGVVVLQGRASSHDRWLCIHCCRRVAGVLQVVDKLATSDERRAMSG